ncbi:hypothetical protein [Roseisolibacter agri]|uniref:Uncharacterized protein n=1 Tax=Roseisolibacter agri TaxID=2014610 RepID=A0AA37QH74_9BACT|nr:hypothetical protein [Roseisolibacter agri]GLC25718.1 hypothetical protein rosag_22310 [Roseisolibacter agri]
MTTPESTSTPREVTDDEGTTWSCVQAFAGLSDDDAAREAAERAAEGDGKLAVVCTPRGGAQSVRVELPPDWASLPDERLLAAIAAARQER